MKCNSNRTNFSERKVNYYPIALYFLPDNQMNFYDKAFQEAHDFLLTEKTAEYPGQHTDENIKIHLNFNGWVRFLNHFIV